MKICLAPMDGITDCAYRIICKQVFEQWGNPNDELMLRTEFMSADGYTHNPPGVIKHILKSDYDHETIAQIFGGNTETLIHCAQDIDKKYDFAGIELNMGCPSPKIMKCAAGSGMLRDKAKTLDIVKRISKSISTPFTIKVRIGLTRDDVADQFQFLLDASPYVTAISIHGRTYGQGHSGEVDWDFIYNIKEKLPQQVVIGNGGIRSYTQAQERCNAGTLGHCDGIMIAQSAIGNPRILTPHTPTLAQRHTTIINHLDLSVASEIYFKQAIENYNHTTGLKQPALQELQQIDLKSQISNLKSPIEFRKYLFNYVSGIPNSKTLKQHIAKTRDYISLKNLITDFFEHTQKNEPI